MSAPKRTSNFSREEESLLIRLVNKYKDVIECRKTDAVTNSSKAKTWNMIAKEFNSGAVTYRDSKTLKNKYDNIKKRSKKKFSQEKCSLFATGGGASKTVHFTDIDEQVKDILGVRIEGHPSTYDDDMIVCDIPENATCRDFIEEYEITSEETQEVQNSDKENQEVSHLEGPEASSHQAEEGSKLNTSHLCTLKSSALRTPEDKENQIAHRLEGPESSRHQTRDWSKLSTSLLRTPKSSALRTAEVKTDCSKKRGAICTKMEKWVESKKSLEDSKEKCLLDEFEMKKQLLMKENKRNWK
ncbi:unnamed protein product [Acanthoscelides obtectus]|uniref:Regulatory protein zeste n=1 Tax=Acanthoscelides obtectus TaxID=200917 RepID=A0A9P0KPP4_ACAOB|nr:unnamed protein product [Acanthoscelides obtectus]CAK1678241.1 Myb/SANT-like DNA-binding domain-containing protein 3 [Acanthoscelides obtectus]